MTAKAYNKPEESGPTDVRSRFAYFGRTIGQQIESPVTEKGKTRKSAAGPPGRPTRLRSYSFWTIPDALRVIEFFTHPPGAKRKPLNGPTENVTGAFIILE